MQAPQAPPLHTLFFPQLAPLARKVPVSWQTGKPVAQDVLPAWQGFEGAQAAPAVQALHTPPPQTRFVPQAVPSAIGTEVSEHTGAPVLQLMVPAWHGFTGVQEIPAWQPTQPPAPSQTLFVPQLVPAIKFVF